MVYLLAFVYGLVLRMAYQLSNILLDKQNGLANHIVLFFLGGGGLNYSICRSLLTYVMFIKTYRFNCTKTCIFLLTIIGFP